MEAKSKTEVDAEIEIWKYVFGFTPMAAVKCAVELKIPDILESHGGAMSHSELASTVGCSPSSLRRVMRYLVHRGFFKQEESTSYKLTPLSRLLLQNGGNKINESVIPLFLMQSSPEMLAPWQWLTSRLSMKKTPAPFEAAHGQEMWEYASKNPAFSKLFYEAMSAHARQAVSEILDRYPQVFEGIGSLVDVGGADGTAISAIVRGCPWIRGINFDLPHVAAAAPHREGVEHVGGNMFEQVPKADAVFTMCVLHDWSDEECVEILKKCKEAIPKERGKVIIVEVVIKEGEEDKYEDVNLALDMSMLAFTDTGKERTTKEWEYVVNKAGFSRYTITHTGVILSVIQAYP